MTTPKYDRTLTLRGAATYLGLSASTLNKLRCTGAGPIYFKLGRAVQRGYFWGIVKITESNLNLFRRRILTSRQHPKQANW